LLFCILAIVGYLNTKNKKAQVHNAKAKPHTCASFYFFLFLRQFGVLTQVRKAYCLAAYLRELEEDIAKLPEVDKDNIIYTLDNLIKAAKLKAL